MNARILYYFFDCSFYKAVAVPGPRCEHSLKSIEVHAICDFVFMCGLLEVIYDLCKPQS